MSFSEHVNRIRLGDKVFTRQALSSEDGQKAMQDAYVAGDRPQCLCQGDKKPLPLYIARWGDGLLLKRMPNSGDVHHPDCESYGHVSPNAHAVYTDEAIAELDDGRVRIALEAPLSLTAGAAPVGDYREAIASDTAGITRKRAKVTLRGLLNYLWEEARLNRWFPAMTGKRGLSVVYHYLRQTLAERELGPRLPLADAIYIPAVRRSLERVTVLAELEAHYAHLQRRHGPRYTPVLLVLGEVLRLDAAEEGSHRLVLKGMANVALHETNGALTRLRASWPTAFSRLDLAHANANTAPEAEPNRVFVLAGVTFTRRRQLSVVYAAALETTHEFIPVESAAEATMARALVHQGRAFEKPLRYDGAAELFPDFRLLDTEPPTVIEVWGMNTPEYLDRKRIKRDTYRHDRVPLIEWNAAADEPLPPLSKGARSCTKPPTVPSSESATAIASASRSGTRRATV